MSLETNHREQDHACQSRWVSGLRELGAPLILRACPRPCFPRYGTQLNGQQAGRAKRERTTALQSTCGALSPEF